LALEQFRIANVGHVASDTFRLFFALKNPNGTAVDLGGYTGSWQVRVRPESSTTVASSTGQNPNATLTIESPASDGKITISTDALTTPGLYYYDVEIVSAGGIRDTIARGHIRVHPEVTR
jgi:hypothetical protein